MEIQFAKWHGTGNDFILIDDRKLVFGDLSIEKVKALCDRHFGIGSDGLILIQPPREQDTAFHMEFFNPDGSKSFCGNGSRCAYAFWCVLAGDRSAVQFTAIDGVHTGEWIGNNVGISIRPVGFVDKAVDGPEVDFIHTGSPHLLVWVPEVSAVDIMTDAPPRRRSEEYQGGTNVNYVQLNAGGIRMRTYERGVEAETLSCGSGVVAAALSALYRGIAHSPVEVIAPGGTLSVEATQVHREDFDRIRLIGPVEHVFSGTIKI